MHKNGKGENAGGKVVVSVKEQRPECICVDVCEAHQGLRVSRCPNVPFGDVIGG